ncbi:MAG: helix-turn-helix domain-containing protein [Tissierellia bacterium]|nr:helix-turn-helix domain-containing protein [Tissierellia bacterium]
MEHFASQLRALRLSHKLTQRELADKLHIGQTAVANYENGTRVPDLSMCIRIADVFQISLDTLTGRKISPAQTSTSPIHTAADYYSALFRGDKARAQKILLDLLHADTPSETIYFQFMEVALLRTGQLWAKGELPVWKEHLISEIVLEHLSLMQMYRKQKVLRHPKNVISLLPGAEQHGIGLRMIGALVEEAGHAVHFLGPHLPADHVLEAIDTLRADAVLLSCTMPENVDTACMLMEKIRREKRKSTPLLIIGGTAFAKMKDPATQTGADHFCMRSADVLEILS